MAPDHRSFLFVMAGDGEPVPVDRHDYARLLRRELALPSYAGREVRVADWYVARSPGKARLVNETYTRLLFDPAGRVCDMAAEGSWEPDPEARERMRAVVGCSSARSADA